MSKRNTALSPARLPTHRRSKPQPSRPTSTRASELLADEIIRDLDRAAAPEPRPHHHGETEDGRRVTTRTAKPLHHVRATLRRKAIEDSISRMAPDELEHVELDSTDLNPPREPTPAERHLAAIWQGEGLPQYGQRYLGMPATPDELARPSRRKPSQVHAAQHMQHMHGAPNTGVAPWQHPAVQWNQQLSPYGIHVLQSDARLSDRFPVYLKYLAQKKTSRSATVGATWSLRILTELIGDKRLCDLHPGDADTFVNALSVWPPHATKKREFRLMKAPKVVEKAIRLNAEPINIRTQQRHIDILRTFFNWLEKRYEVIPGLLKGVRLYSSTDDIGEHRQPFDTGDLKVLFDSAHDASFKVPHQYWARFLGLYQGMRVNEIGQLYVDDIVKHGTLWCINVTKDRPGQRLKNRQSRRLLPLHPVLIGMGFLDFVAQAKSWNRATLFPGVTWGDNGPGDTISDWFSRSYLRGRCGIANLKKTFHSFRHTFATIGELSGLRDTRIALLLGHSAGDSILRTSYVHSVDASEMDRDMANMQFPVLHHMPYVPEQYEHAFAKADRDEVLQEKLDVVYGRAA